MTRRDRAGTGGMRLGEEESSMQILNATTQPIVVIDRECTIRELNLAAAALFGYLRDELLGQSLSLLIAFPRATDHDALRMLVATDPSGEGEVLRCPPAYIRAHHKRGSTLQLCMTMCEIDSNGSALSVLTIHDKTDQLREEFDLIRYIHDLESARDQSETHAEKLACQVEELVDDKAKLLSQKKQLRDNENELQEYIRDLEMTRSQFEKQARRMVHLAEKLNSEKERVWNSRKIIQHQASHDPLTDLGNRALLNRVLPVMMEEAKAAGTMVGLIYLDLDNFKSVNDRMGHEEGDNLLRAVAEALRKNIRAEDEAIRQGGDEFAIVVRLSESRSTKDVQELAERLCKALTISVRGPDFTIQISASIGIALYPENGETVDEILVAADAAMYRAKRAGKGRIAESSKLD